MVCSFSLAHYREILETSIEHNYEFISFDSEKSKLRELRETIGKADISNCCILRHDIDYLPEHAPRLGRVEAELGIRATYFFQIGARTYNLRDAINWKAVHELKKMGHIIGLHFDVDWRESIQWHEIAAQCSEEKDIFSQMLGFEPCEIISFHNPGEFKDQILNKDITGIRHTYEKRFFKDCRYLSDSQGWYEGCPCNVFREERYPLIHLLTHPYIWPVESSGFIADMAAMVEQRRRELLEYLIEFHPVCAQHEEDLRYRLGL